MITQNIHTATVDEYMALERQSPARHEFINGEIRPMPYTSENHSLLIANLIGTLHVGLKGTACRVYPSDRMLHVPDCNRFYYPDVMVVCGESQFFYHKLKMHATLNPTVLIEVLSDSTAAFDEVDKWNCYKKIKTLRQFLLVSQNRMLVELFNRVADSNEWLNTSADSPEQTIQVADCAISLPDLYASVALIFTCKASATLKLSYLPE